MLNFQDLINGLDSEYNDSDWYELQAVEDFEKDTAGNEEVSDS